MRAAITPGTHPHSVNIETIRTDPQPLFSTASGGKRMAKRTFQKPIEQNYNIYFYVQYLVLSSEMIFNQNRCCGRSKIGDFRFCISRFILVSLLTYFNLKMYATF